MPGWFVYSNLFIFVVRQGTSEKARFQKHLHGSILNGHILRCEESNKQLKTITRCTTVKNGRYIYIIRKKPIHHFLPGPPEVLLYTSPMLYWSINCTGKYVNLIQSWLRPSNWKSKLHCLASVGRINSTAPSLRLNNMEHLITDLSTKWQRKGTNVFPQHKDMPASCTLSAAYTTSCLDCPLCDVPVLAWPDRGKEVPFGGQHSSSTWVYTQIEAYKNSKPAQNTSHKFFWKYQQLTDLDDLATQHHTAPTTSDFLRSCWETMLGPKCGASCEATQHCFRAVAQPRNHNISQRTAQPHSVVYHSLCNLHGNAV